MRDGWDLIGLLGFLSVGVAIAVSVAIIWGGEEVVEDDNHTQLFQELASKVTSSATFNEFVDVAEKANEHVRRSHPESDHFVWADNRSLVYVIPGRRVDVYVSDAGCTGNISECIYAGWGSYKMTGVVFNSP